MRHLHDIQRMLEEAHFQWMRCRGSHHIWRHMGTGRIVIVVYKRSFSRCDVEHLQRLMAAAARGNEVA